MGPVGCPETSVKYYSYTLRKNPEERRSYPLLLLDFKDMLIFWTDFRKINEVSNFINIRSLGAELLPTDGQTDVTKLIVAYRNFANAPKKSQHFVFTHAVDVLL